MNLWVLYGESNSGKSTFMEQYKKNSKEKIITRDIALMFDMKQIGYHKKEFKTKIIEIVNDIQKNNSPDIIGIEIPVSESWELDCDKQLYNWIKDIENDFDKIYIHLFKDKYFYLNKLTQISTKSSIIKHNSFVIFNQDLSKNKMSCFDDLFNTIMTTKEYIEFKKIIDYPDFIQLCEKNLGREGKCYTENYENSYWEQCEDLIEDNSDKIWTELFELLTVGNYELKSMNPIQWKIFEKSAIFETTEHYHDYYESGTRYITYLSLPDIFKFVKE